ncbi:MAG: tRNA isopentenyl-2-thiomethyl-A-37 hydroxylase MiaE [Oscillatoria sp. PMC 1068.18]|nr:tRNA isopentenyl-2-thiomethyl-A-37 hydroxylase MiaE [Oscillatoria sp. PMC 1076.18]MEC4989177.1 tRNA isopentenyl-2-thiomethyl-A-37 hydroxylase MiaE [Oscillatoria sp. PMC 1068.18]
MKSVTKIKILQKSTSVAWVEQAIANLDRILLDHSHCELKAASTAINFMFRYPARTRLVRELTSLAQEELEHYELVNQWLERRGVALAPLNAPPYGATLKGEMRRQEPDRLLDSLLIASLIEARSHERLGLLAAHCPDPDLAKFYHGLMASEARHYGVYWLLAASYFDQEVLEKRLQELAMIESEILVKLHPEPRIHS